MSDVARNRYAVGSVLALLGTVLLVRLVACDPSAVTTGDGDGDGTGGVLLGDSSASFGIAGDATEPISPGVMVPLDLAITNPYDRPMSVIDLSVSVQDVSASDADDVADCRIDDFAVDQASSSLEITVAAEATSTLSSLGLRRAQWPHVGMPHRAADQDGCQGVSLVLDYSASGTLDN